MKHIKIALLFFCFIISQITFSQSPKEIKPLFFKMESLTNDDESASFNNYQSSCDSIIHGINGNAFYFNQAPKQNKHVILGHETVSPELWSNNFSVIIWVATKSLNKDYQVIASNKEWNSGNIKDYTTNHAFGFSRTTGSNKGWAIICQPDGSWAWNIGDGKRRLDYRPTAPRQQINDGAWHQIAFSISKDTNEAYLYFDGINVAIYNTKGLGELNTGNLVSLATDIIADPEASAFQGGLDELEIYDRVLSAKEVATNYSKYVPSAILPQLANEPVKELNLMTWNIWHGGRRHGREIGPKQVINFIKDTNTDIIMMQETYGSGPLIADALGYYFYLASTNISVMSKYPIISTSASYDSFRLGKTCIQLSKNQKINLASLWIHYLPDWRNDAFAPNVTAKKLVDGEGATRHKEIKEILEILKPEINNADNIPLIIGGDYNSPSLLDWTSKTKVWHNNLVVEWPVSKEMLASGFKDSFREINPKTDYASPTMSAEEICWRIDYIYYKGKKVKAIDSEIHFKYKGIWPSDHPAVTTTVKFTEY